MKSFILTLSACLVIIALAGGIYFYNQKQTPVNEIVYPARGVITEWGKEGVSAFIHHEKIEDFMEEMTMLLSASNTNEFSGVRPGDQITFDLVLNQESGTHIRNIRKTGKHYPEKVRKDEDSILAKMSGSDLKVGDPMPSFSLIGVDGGEVTEKSYEGQTVALTFIFTRCPIPEFCPLMTAHFSAVESILSETLSDGWKLVSVTMDPSHDTPEVLGNYAAARKIDLKKWDFLTGDEEEIRKLGDPLGLYFNTDSFPIEHNLRTAIFDKNGQLVKIFTGNQWSPDELANVIKPAHSE